MNSDNKSESSLPSKQPADPILLLWSLLTVVGSAITGGIAGLSIGAALGTYAPGYYRSIFSRGDSPRFDPFAVGVGQGVTQGFAAGAAIGLILVALFYWFRSRELPVS